MLGLLAGVVGSAAAWGVTSEPAASPYEGIVDRNAFGLKPPPPPPDPEAAKPPPAKITLTGITTILGNKRALMETPPPQGKPGEQPKGKQSYILTIGQREGDIEVLDIDEKAGSVKVNNAGAVVTLTFDKDGAKLPATPAPAPPGVIPGAVPGAPGGIPAPAAAAASYPRAGAVGSGYSLPTRTLRTGRTPGIVNPGMGNPPAGLTAAVPGLPVYGAGANRSQAINDQLAAQQQNALSPEQQMLMLEAQREMNKNNPKFPPLPPTALNPGATEGASRPPPLPQ